MNGFDQNSEERQLSAWLREAADSQNPDVSNHLAKVRRVLLETLEAETAPAGPHAAPRTDDAGQVVAGYVV